MIRYLTWWALKADKRSLKSWYIRGHAFQGVCGEGKFRNCVHPLMHRPALPVTVLAGLHYLYSWRTCGWFLPRFSSASLSYLLQLSISVNKTCPQMT